MPVGASQYCRITKETTYGQYDVTQHGTSNEIWMRLEGDNACTVRRQQISAERRGADGFNRRVLLTNPKYRVGGALACSIYPTQAATLLGLLVNTTGNELDSFTLDYFDGTRSLSFLGCKFASGRLSSAGSQDDTRLAGNFSIVGQSTGTPNVNFTAPAASAFPSETPYVHVELSGGLVIGTSRSKFKSFELNLENLLATPFDDLATISNCSFAGRNVGVSVAVQYLTTADRIDFETTPQAAVAMSALFTKASPAHTLSLDFKSTCFLRAITDEIPLGGATYQALSIQAFFDRTAGTDLSLTTT